MTHLFRLTGLVRSGLFVVLASTLPLGHAATLWTGPNTYWIKSVATPSDTILPGKVVLTRGASDVLYNTAAGEAFAGQFSPLGTLWAFGDITNYESLSFQTLESMRNGNLAALLLNHPMVMHITNDDIYLSVTFTNWGQGGAGTVAYTRSTPPPPPTLWTGPSTNWTKSVATPSDTILPGKVVLARDGRDVLYNTAAGEPFAGQFSPLDTMWAFGDITNYATLSFQTLESLRNGDLSTRLVNHPMVVHLLNENIYLSLTFTNWGRFGSGTVAYTRSTPAVAPIAVVLTAPTANNGQFSFNYSADPGLRYLIERSSNFLNWIPVATNLAASNPVHFSEAVTGNSPLFYRVGRLPNP